MLRARQAVEQFLVDRAVLPIENSLGVCARRPDVWPVACRVADMAWRRGAFTATLTCCFVTACTSWERSARCTAARRAWRLLKHAEQRCCERSPQVNLKVNPCLLALPGVKREDVKRVMSHPQARRHTPLRAPGARHVAGAQAATCGCDAGVVAVRRLPHAHGSGQGSS